MRFCPLLHSVLLSNKTADLLRMVSCLQAAQKLREVARGSDKKKREKQRLGSSLNESDIFIWHYLGQTSLSRNTVFPGVPTRHIAKEDHCEIRDAEGFTVTNQLTGA